MSRPSGAAIAMGGLFVIGGFPLAVLAGMDVSAALVANGALVAVVVPWTWRVTSRYQASAGRAAETERLAHLNRRNRKVLGVLFVVCVCGVLIRMVLPH